MSAASPADRGGGRLAKTVPEPAPLTRGSTASTAVRRGNMKSSHDVATSTDTLEALPPKDALWTIHDAARFLSCSTKTVRALLRHEGLPGFRLRSRLRFVPGDVLEWARRRGKEVY